MPASTRRGRTRRALGHPRDLVRVPRPGFPAFVYAHPNGRLYAGTYTNPQGDDERSRVFEWTRRGTLPGPGPCPARTSRATRASRSRPATPRGRLVVLEKSTSRVMRLEHWGPVGSRRTPGSRTCRPARPAPSPTGPARPTSPTVRRSRTTRRGAGGGELYVTDYGQAVIWRVPPGGGQGRRRGSPTRGSTATEFGTAGLLHGARDTGRCCSPSRRRSTEPASRRRARCTGSPIRDDGRPGAAAGAVDQPARRPARRVRHRPFRADLRRQRRVCRTSSSCCPRRGRSSSASRSVPGHRRERLDDPVRHPVERDVRRPPRLRGQPELHRQPRPPRDPRRLRRRARRAGLDPALRRPLSRAVSGHAGAKAPAACHPADKRTEPRQGRDRRPLPPRSCLKRDHAPTGLCPQRRQRPQGLVEGVAGDGPGAFEVGGSSPSSWGVRSAENALAGLLRQQRGQVVDRDDVERRGLLGVAVVSRRAGSVPGGDRGVDRAACSSAR